MAGSVESSPDPVAGRDPSPVAFVAIVLALVTGFVDAFGFLHVVPVFPANQSGNAVFLGMSIGGTSPAPGWAPPVAIATFMIGAAAGRWTALRVGVRRSAPILLGVETLLLVALAVARAAASTSAPFTTTAAQAAVLAVAALAMGSQTEVIRSVAGVAVSTTYQSGAIARIAETIGMGRGQERDTERRLLVVLSALLVAYVAGAALGASGLGDGRIGLVTPALLVAGLFAVTCRGVLRSDEGW